ncbi:MAG: glycosyltransferase, partial [Kiloniellales bacterium]|nr:glycosyltransferase [Kiloniellales bacterium]
MSLRPAQRIALAAGGTGGHLFPAQALARALLGRGCQVMLITDERGEGFGSSLPEVETHRIASGGIAGIGFAGRVKNMMRLGMGYFQARGVLKRSGADCVVGFGGYPSVPPVMAAAHLGLRVVLHEQNSVLGRANRALLPRAQILCTSFSNVDRVPKDQMQKVRLTGNPVRPAVEQIGRRPYLPPSGDSALGLLVIGGSQGAKVFNDLVPQALSALPEMLRQRLIVSQQVPGDAQQQIATHYRDAGIKADLSPFFTDLP